MPSALEKKQSALSGNSRRLLACGFLLLVAGIGIRLWHDRNAPSAAPLDVESLQHQAASATKDPDAHIALGAALQKAGRLDEARQEFVSAEKLNPADARPEVWLGMVAVQKNELRQAAVYFEEALRRDPSDADTCRSLGELYERQGAVAKAIPLYERATQLRANDAEAWRMLGIAEVRISRFALGREALLHAIKLDVNDSKAQQALADIDLRLGMLDESRQSYNAVLKHTPDDPSALAGCAQASVQLDSSPDGLRIAEDQVERAIKLQALPRGYLVRGQIALLRQNYSAAIADLNHAVSVDPNLAEAYGYLSQAYAATGHPEQARLAVAAYQKADAQRKRAIVGAIK